MKTLLVIRHAKAESAFTLNDFDRPLTERGMNDASIMAEKIMAHKISIKAFISSPAKRAKTTAELISNKLGTENEIIFDRTLYQATAQAFFKTIKGLDNDADTVALFSHNPGITYFVNQLVSFVQIDNMPTCAVFAVKANCINWSDFARADKQFLFFEYPKM